jgi:MFS family permease
MIRERTLGLAVAQGVITAEQAERLRALDASADGSSVPEDPEKLRFISGFGDIFVALGIGLFLVPAGYFASIYAGLLGRWLAVAILAWLLAEFFTRKRRMALPSILLLVVFVASGFAALLSLFGMLMPEAAPGYAAPGLWFIPDLRGPAVAAAALASVALAVLHYLRFRVPITIAAGAAALCMAIVAVARLAVPDLSVAAVDGLLLGYGVLVFLVAMRFDMRDRDRATRRTDIAFWLHLLAAPLIVHSLIRGFLGGLGPLDMPHAVGVLVVFLALGAIAVAIDRRALLVSGLIYAGFAFSALIRQTGFSDTLLPTTVLALGVFVLALSAGWRPLRRVLLGRLPAGLARRLPHPLVVST